MNKFTGFSLAHFQNMFSDTRLMLILAQTFFLAFLSSLIATAIGTFGAIYIYQARKKYQEAFLSVNNILMVAPDVMIGASFLILFTTVKFQLGFLSVLASHIAFSIPIVVLMILPRLKEMNDDMIKAAYDLGSSQVQMLRSNMNMYNEWAVDYAASRNLIVAENDHAVLFAGFGHRYPTLEVYSKSATCEPWRQSEEEIRAMSDLVHAAHAAVGREVPCNEEWHHKPADVDVAQPWRILIKLRISTLAGFEGGTKIYLNTISPSDLRDRVVSQLYPLRESGHVQDFIKVMTVIKSNKGAGKRLDQHFCQFRIF